MVPACEACKLIEGKGCKLQPRFQSSNGLIQRCGLNVFAKFRPVGLLQTMGVALIPAKTATKKKALVTDRDLTTGHYIAR